MCGVCAWRVCVRGVCVKYVCAWCVCRLCQCVRGVCVECVSVCVHVVCVHACVARRSVCLLTTVDSSTAGERTGDWAMSEREPRSKTRKVNSNVDTIASAVEAICTTTMTLKQETTTPFLYVSYIGPIHFSVAVVHSKESMRGMKYN